MYCTARDCDVLHYGVLYCTVLYCYIVQCTMTYCTGMYCDVLFCDILYYNVITVLWCTVLWCFLLSLAVLWLTLWWYTYCSVMWYTVLWCFFYYFMRFFREHFHAEIPIRWLCSCHDPRCSVTIFYLLPNLPLPHLRQDAWIFFSFHNLEAKFLIKVEIFEMSSSHSTTL